MERLTIWRTKLERPSAGLLAVGLLVAIVAADDLPTAWSTALFALLLVLDGITIAWLTRPCCDKHPSPTPLRNQHGMASALPRCGSAR